MRTRKSRFGWMVGFMILSGGYVFSSHCEETAVVAFKEVSGIVTSVNPLKDLLVVKPQDVDSAAQQEIILTINPSTIIEKDYNPADLSKITTGDQAEITYSIDASGKNIVVELIAAKK